MPFLAKKNYCKQKQYWYEKFIHLLSCVILFTWSPLLLICSLSPQKVCHLIKPEVTLFLTHISIKINLPLHGVICSFKETKSYHSCLYGLFCKHYCQTDIAHHHLHPSLQSKVITQKNKIFCHDQH